MKESLSDNISYRFDRNNQIKHLLNKKDGLENILLNLS